MRCLIAVVLSAVLLITSVASAMAGKGRLTEKDLKFRRKVKIAHTNRIEQIPLLDEMSKPTVAVRLGKSTVLRDDEEEAIDELEKVGQGLAAEAGMLGVVIFLGLLALVVYQLNEEEKERREREEEERERRRRGGFRTPPFQFQFQIP